MTFGLVENTKRAIKSCCLSCILTITQISFIFQDGYLFILAYKYFLLAASTLSPTTIVSRVTSSPVLTTEFTNITSQQNDTIIRTKPTLFDRKITHFVYLVALLNVRMKLCDEEDFSFL